MNSIYDFLAELTKQDIKLWVEGERLRCNAPQGVLTGVLRAQIAEHKAEIISFLKQVNSVLDSKVEEIKPVPRDGNLPLSFAQQRLWFLQQIEGSDAVYNIPAAIKLQGSLNIAALGQALNAIAQRHEVLRTRFEMVDNSPVQVIESNIELGLAVIDLQNLSDEDKSVEVQSLVTTEAKHPFDLTQVPLWRVKLLRLEENVYVFLLTMHHIIADGWSLGVLVRELSVFYQAFCKNKSISWEDAQLSVLKPLSIQYADFAVYQRQWLTGEVLEGQLNYWKQQLSNAALLLNLPTDHPRGALQTFSGRSQSFTINSQLTQKLKQVAQNTNATLFMILLAAWGILLSRYSQQQDLVIGSPIANRNHKQIEPLIGFFANTLALRFNLEDNPSFTEYLARVKQVTLDAYAHQDLPFERLVEELQPERNLSYSPLFQVMFALQNAPLGELKLPGLSWNELKTQSKTAKFDLTLAMRETNGVLEGNCEYNCDLFEDATISRMIGHFQTLLAAIVTEPESSVANLPLLTPTEKHQLLVEWNATESEYISNKYVDQLFEEQVEKTPEAIAVVFAEEKLSYQQLNLRANQLAHYLQNLGVKEEAFVGLCIERTTPEMLVAMLAILKAGGAYVPLDPNYPPERLEFMLFDAQIEVLLTQHKWVTKLPESQAQLVCVDTEWEVISEQSEENPVRQFTPDSLAYIIYTSGSTGKPKGVAVPHRGIARLLLNTNYVQINFTDNIAQISNISFDAATFEIWGALLHGAKLVVIDQDTVLSPHDFAKCIPEQEITISFLTNALFERLASVVPQAFQYFRYLLVGGEAVNPQLARELLKNNPPQQLLNGYGPTESTTFACCYSIEEVPPNATNIPIGRPISNTKVYILDRQLQPVPIGVPGELHIGGDGLAQGYLNRPELNAEKFIPNPFEKSKEERSPISNDPLPTTKLYKTGDLARYLPDGNIEYLGRIDNQVKIRGFRIELGEIETAIAQHPQVQQIAVIVREDKPGNKRLVGYVVPRESSLTTKELQSFLKQKLPEYMVPSTFMLLEAMPLTPNGKADRRKLLTIKPTWESAASDFVIPSNDTETKLAVIWAEVLGLERVGIHDNFFALGGDSILSIQVVSRANQVGLGLTPKQLFQHQSIAELAAVVKTTVPTQAQQSLVTGSVPLTPIQYWFFEQNLKPQSQPHHFNQSVLLELAADVKPELLQELIKQLLEHHDALRLQFARISNGNWEQINAAPTVEIPFQIQDLSNLPPTEQRAALETAANQLQASLDLSTKSLLQATLFNFGNNQSNQLLIIIHHLAVDGVSWRILLEDFSTGYQQLISIPREESEIPPTPLNKGDKAPIPLVKGDIGGSKIKFPSKTTSFQQWANRLQEYGKSETLAAELDYWLIQSRFDATSLPVDYPHNEENNTLANAAMISVALSKEETQSLLQKVPSAYKTQINDVLLTALLQSFVQWTGDNTLLVDLEGHGREDLFDDIDLSRTVGWFTSIFPVHLHLESPEPGQAIKSVKEQLRRIPKRGIGYGVLRYLSPDRATRTKLEVLPSPQISFNYLGQFEQTLNAPGILGVVRESIGSECSPFTHRRHLLEVNSIIVEQKLQFSWTYSQKVHRRQTIASLADNFLQALQALIAHCQSPSAQGYTPSDFAAAKLNQKQLDKFVNKFKGKKSKNK